MFLCICPRLHVHEAGVAFAAQVFARRGQECLVSFEEFNLKSSISTVLELVLIVKLLGNHILKHIPLILELITKRAALEIEQDNYVNLRVVFPLAGKGIMVLEI